MEKLGIFIMTKKCAIIGDRLSNFSFGYDEENYKCLDLKQILYTKILELSKNGFNTFITGMDLGVGIWVAEIVNQLNKSMILNLNLVCVLPCETQADKWTAHQREKYFNMIEKSTEVIYIRKNYENRCYFERDIHMVNECDMLVCVGSNSSSELNSIIEYCKNSNKDLLILDNID